MQDGKASAQYFADYNGKRIYFCCDSCVQLFKKNPEQYMKDLQNRGVILEDSPQPVVEILMPVGPEKDPNEDDIVE